MVTLDTFKLTPDAIYNHKCMLFCLMCRADVELYNDKNKFLSRATAIVVIGPRQIGKPNFWLIADLVGEHHYKRQKIQKVTRIIIATKGTFQNSSFTVTLPDH